MGKYSIWFRYIIYIFFWIVIYWIIFLVWYTASLWRFYVSSACFCVLRLFFTRRTAVVRRSLNRGHLRGKAPILSPRACHIPAWTRSTRAPTDSRPLGVKTSHNGRNASRCAICVLDGGIAASIFSVAIPWKGRWAACKALRQVLSTRSHSSPQTVVMINTRLNLQFQMFSSRKTYFLLICCFKTTVQCHSCCFIWLTHYKCPLTKINSVELLYACPDVVIDSLDAHYRVFKNTFISDECGNSTVFSEAWLSCVIDITDSNSKKAKKYRMRPAFHSLFLW